MYSLLKSHRFSPSALEVALHIVVVCVLHHGANYTEASKEVKTKHLGMHVCALNCFSGVQLYVTLWTIACQAPWSMGFSSKEYWSELVNCHALVQGI